MPPTSTEACQKTIDYKQSKIRIDYQAKEKIRKERARFISLKISNNIFLKQCK